MPTYNARYKTGRCANGYARDAGLIVHAVPKDAYPWDRALCGTKPGARGNGWSEYEQDGVTCEKCLNKIARKALNQEVMGE